MPLPSESEEESESELSSVSGSESEEDSEAERVYGLTQAFFCQATPIARRTHSFARPGNRLGVLQGRGSLPRLITTSRGFAAWPCPGRSPAPARGGALRTRAGTRTCGRRLQPLLARTKTTATIRSCTFLWSGDNGEEMYGLRAGRADPGHVTESTWLA